MCKSPRCALRLQDGQQITNFVFRRHSGECCFRKYYYQFPESRLQRTGSALPSVSTRNQSPGQANLVARSVAGPTPWPGAAVPEPDGFATFASQLVIAVRLFARAVSFPRRKGAQSGPQTTPLIWSQPTLRGAKPGSITPHTKFKAEVY